MVRVIIKYKAFGIGLLLLILVVLSLEYVDFISIPKDDPLEVFFISAFWWLVISLLLHNLPYLKKKKNSVYQILGLLGLLTVTIVIDSSIQIPDNPLTIFLLILFWGLAVYIVAPGFVRKYKYLIVGLYSCLLIYFTYVRLFSGGLERYLEHKKELALLLIVMPVPFFFALWVYEQWKWLRTLQADKSKAELALLKTQVNPHFFFNTLNNLYSLTVQHSDKAPEVILKLSDMMRYTIYEGAKEFVPIRDEVTYLESYIALHRIRYHKTVDIRFDHTITADVPVAPLLFIILLENAFKHGVASLPTSPYVNMQLTSNAEEVSFILENNFDPGEVSQQDGIGLGNLRRRLELIYPDRYEFVVTANKNIFRVTLKIQML